MSFPVKFYAFIKKDNSTKQPNDAETPPMVCDCILKDKSSILHPEIQLNLGLSEDPSQFNYARIDAYNRYYFIDEWTFEKGLWTASMRVDVLATYRLRIGLAHLYVLRAASDYDGDVVDTLYPVQTGCNFSSTTKTNPWTTFCCIIGCVSKNANVGSLAYYVMTPFELSTVCTNLQDQILDDVTNSANGFNIADAAPALQLSLVNPLQYIKSCIMLPVPVVDVPYGGSGNAIIYNWDAGVTGRRVNSDPHITKTYTFDIIKHPDTNDRGNYVNAAPYTNISLTIPPFGTIDIDTSVTCNASTLTAEVIVDPLSGKGILVVKCNGIILNRIESQLGVPISLSQVTRDYIGAATSAAGAVGGAVSGYAAGGAGGAVLGSLSGIGSAIQSLVSRSNTVGTTGGFGSLQGDFRLDHQFFRPVPDDNFHHGRPYCKTHIINDFSGYVQVQDGDVPLNGTATEAEEVRSLLEGGFYYE